MDVKHQKIGRNFAVYNADCCEVAMELENDSIGFCGFSPPFMNLYSYSDELADMGNCKTRREFFEHFDFLVAELQRVMMPGRVVAVHCMDMPLFKRDGELGIYDFPGAIVKCFRKHGFVFHSRHVIWKDPLVAAVRTKALGLAHKQLCKDSSECRMGISDMIVAFRKKGENQVPISNENGLDTYHGGNPMPRKLDRFMGHVDARTNKRSHWIWQQYASPVWMDIRQGKVLPFRGGKDDDDEKHICPLQIDVVERFMVLWSTKGDIVFDPFMGIGTLPYCALKSERKVIACDLKFSYYKQALLNIRHIAENPQSGLG